MAQPTIDDQYWFDLSKKMVDEASTVRNEALVKLQTMVAWFWSVYTTAITIGTITAKNLPGYVFALLALPSAILILAYWMTVRAQVPAKVEFDPRSPDDIQRAFKVGMATKHKTLAIALLFTFLAAIALGIGLYTLGTEKDRKPTVCPTAAVADFSAVQQVIRQPFVRITGTIPDANTVQIVVRSADLAAKEGINFLVPVGAKNTLVCNLPVKTEMKRYDVVVSWASAKDKSMRTIAKSF